MSSPLLGARGQAARSTVPRTDADVIYKAGLKPAVVIVVNLIVTVTIFLSVEGVASYIFVAKRAFLDEVVAERRHTQYDEGLGWVNLPNLLIRDMYGPGLHFRTNSQLFRNDREFGRRVPDGRIRIICSGDSYTMGYGVDNAQTWCQLLESRGGRIETINMGQGGYGVDQAYLWYKRNSPEFDHDVHVFAFITADFQRMRHDTFVGYGKPLLALQDDVIVNTNHPVPIRSYLAPRLNRIQRALPKLRSVWLWKQFFPPETKTRSAESDERLRMIVSKIFQDLQGINQAKNSELVLVYLPTQADFLGQGSNGWRGFLHAEAARSNLIFFDLVDEIRKVPPQKFNALFRGHYSEIGNAYVADILYEKLLATPEVLRKLER